MIASEILHLKHRAFEIQNRTIGEYGIIPARWDQVKEQKHFRSPPVLNQSILINLPRYGIE